MEQYIDPLQTMIDHQETLVLLNGIFSFGIVGILYSLILCIHVFDRDHDMICIPGEGMEEAENLKKIRSWCNVIGKSIAFIALIPALVISADISNFYSQCHTCSDSITNGVLLNMYHQFDKSYQKNIQVLVLDVCMMAVAILTTLYEIFCKKEIKQPESYKALMEKQES